MTWIQTLEGSRFDLLEPSPSAIDPNTLAICLARKCRFGGHCTEFYSVAQHSLFVASLLPANMQLYGLLHDAHEAYSGFGDVLNPAKRLDPEVRMFLSQHEHRIDCAIADRFGLHVGMFSNDRLKHADLVALATEARDLMAPAPCAWMPLPTPHFETIEPWSIDESYRRFTARLYELWSD